MGEPVKQASTPKRTRKVAAKMPATVAAPIKRTVKAAEPAATVSKPIIAHIEDTVQAVASPARESDIVPEMAAPSPPIERIADMVTVKTPTEGFEKGQALLGDATARFKTAFEKSSKIGEDMVDFAKGNVEAVVASARVAAKAGESFGQDAADYSKKQLESATALFKSFANVKSPTELFQLQSDFAKSAFDSAVAEASRVSESMMKVAGEIAQPLSSRYAVAAEKIKANAL